VGSRHTDLRAYRLAATLADGLTARVAAFPALERWAIGVQLARSAGSVGANIAEAFGRGTSADIKRFLVIARGSLLETEHWIDRAAARDLLDASAYDEILSELGRTLNGLIRSERLR
jgi:four helix bundle protein